MNGELALSFILATHGSAWLAVAATTGSAPSRSISDTRRFATTLSFAHAGNVDSWLEGLAARGVDRIWLAIPDLASPRGGGADWHRKAAFAGGLPAGLLTTTRSGNELWSASWNVGDTAASDRRIWDVTYRCNRVDVEPQRPGVDEAAAGLDAALARAEEFAAHLNLDPWHTVFREARLLPPTGSGSTRPGWDPFPAGSCSDACRQLVAMADAGWVFGGMGSWNDLPFLGAEADAEYGRISQDLFTAIMVAYVAAANAHVAASAHTRQR